MIYELGFLTIKKYCTSIEDKCCKDLHMKCIEKNCIFLKNRNKIRKQYLLFAGSDDKPEGGMNDYVNKYNTVAEALHRLEKIPLAKKEWWHIINCKTLASAMSSEDEEFFQ